MNRRNFFEPDAPNEPRPQGAADAAKSERTLQLELLKSEFAIVRLAPDAPIPESARGEFVSITRTADELSIVSEGSGFRCLKIEGPLDFSLVGILAAIAGTLARAEVPIFAISTFDTDYILVQKEHLERAIGALERDGHVVRR